MDQTHRTIMNAIYGLLGSVWPLVFSLLITPIIVSNLGYKEYGVYVFISTVLSMLGLLDFGLSTAIKKYLSEYHAQKETEKIYCLVGTANIIFIGIGILGMTLIFIGIMLSSIMPLLTPYSVYKIGLMAAGLLFFINTISSVANIIPSALQRFDIGFKIGLVVLTIQQISILVLVINGYNINAIFITQLIIALFNLFIQIYISNKILPNTIYRISWNIYEAKKNYIFGAVTFINNLATTSLTYLDRLIIPFFLGSASLSYYSLPGNISNRIPSISNSLAGILFPLASSLNGTGNKETLKKLYVRSFRLITVLAITLGVVTISYAKELLTYWISPELGEKASTVLIILAITNVLLAIIGPLSQFLLGMGKLKFLTILSISMAIANTILILILIKPFGIVGVALAYLLSLLPAIYMFYYTEKHYLGLDNRMRYYISMLLKNILVSSIVLSVSFIFLKGLATSLWLVILFGGVSGIFYLVTYRLFGFFEMEDMKAIDMIARNFIKKIW